MRSSGLESDALAAWRQRRQRAARSCRLEWRNVEKWKQRSEVLDEGGGKEVSVDVVGEEEAQHVHAALRGHQAERLAVQHAAEAAEHQRSVAGVAEVVAVEGGRVDLAKLLGIGSEGIDGIRRWIGVVSIRSFDRIRLIGVVSIRSFDRIRLIGFGSIRRFDRIRLIGFGSIGRFDRIRLIGFVFIRTFDRIRRIGRLLAVLRGGLFAVCGLDLPGLALRGLGESVINALMERRHQNQHALQSLRILPWKPGNELTSAGSRQWRNGESNGGGGGGKRGDSGGKRSGRLADREDWW